ncbi:hypothetical protein D3C75_448290 [compost metagenome]
MKVKIVKLDTELYNGDLTVGNIYETDSDEVSNEIHITDDAGQPNLLYAGEFEVIDAE